jgi:hypothetical protein
MQALNITQGPAATVWTIVHNQETNAMVLDVLINDGGAVKKVVPQSIEFPDVNTVVITFSTAQNGFVRLIG